MTDRDLMQTELGVARELVARYFETEDCPWQGRYNGQAQECRCCPDNTACRWLFEEESPVLAEQLTTDQLRTRLWFAVVYLEGRLLEEEHDWDICRCAVCTWIGKCRDLLADHAGAEPELLLSAATP